ncbi:MAG TPA: hypothetical protein VJ715_00820, partial [Pyrinomonadaceae bacterium]|nr:hypothetical protein [Pyrinomonadaceae bacterium]
MKITRPLLTACTVLLAVSSFAGVARAQSRVEAKAVKPDVRRSLGARAARAGGGAKRKGGYEPARNVASLSRRPTVEINATVEAQMQRRAPARVRKQEATGAMQSLAAAALPKILAGTPLSWILHTSQLSLTSLAGSNEQYVDATGNLVADERTTFDADGGSFDIA